MDEIFYVREVQETPDSLINKNGEVEYGTFKDSFKEFNFLEFKRPNFPRFIKKLRLTEWEAIEVFFDDKFFISAVFKMGVLAINMALFYDVKTNELIDLNSKSLFTNAPTICPSLVDGGTSIGSIKDSRLEIVNHLNNGYTKVKADIKVKNNHLHADFKLNRCAKPSVVCIPLTKINPLYTEKDLLVPEGKITMNGETFILNENHIAIIDDHRGYYPYSSGYDWVTTLKDIVYKGEKSKFGINLTYFYKNHDQEKYNENGYWINGEYYMLPVAKFIRTKNIWEIKDEYGLIDLKFTQKNQHKMYINTLVVKLDYVLAFGSISGTITTKDNVVITLDNDFALGEKRLTRV